MRVECLNKDWLALVQDILINKKKPLYARLKGESMFPTIKDLETVKIEPLRDEVKNKEVILYKDDRGKPIVHRVVDVFTQDGYKNYLVRCDNNWYGGDIIKENQVLGKVTFIRHNNKDIPVENIKTRYLYLFFRRIRRYIEGIFRKIRMFR